METSNINDSEFFTDSDSDSSFTNESCSKEANNGVKDVYHTVEELVTYSPKHSEEILYENDADFSLISASSDNEINSYTKSVQDTVTKEVVDASRYSLPATLSSETDAHNTFSMPESLDLFGEFNDHFISNNMRSSTPVPSDKEFQQEDEVMEFDNPQEPTSPPTSANCTMSNTQLLDGDNENEELQSSNGLPTPKFNLDCGVYVMRVNLNEGRKEYICYTLTDKQIFDVVTCLKSSSIIPSSNSTNQQQQIPKEIITSEDSKSEPNSSGSTKTNKKIDQGKKKSFRAVFTEDQKASLEMFYAKDQYITNETAEEIGASMGLSYERVAVWYKNRRAKDKKKK